jgi:hypothetical protein
MSHNRFPRPVAGCLRRPCRCCAHRCADFRLSTDEALDPYPYRWRIGHPLFDLTEVRNLNHLSAPTPTQWGIQVYTARVSSLAGHPE